ncbi:MAG: hypothetical protein EOP11_14140 [Proteobacteria bacterium]|nr:MAG: hypothetical protein EOP11_14140 [Pseudomonadota bacterium]
MKFLSILFLAFLAIGSPSAFAGRAVYEVPVPQELAGFARYDFDEFRVEEKDNVLHVRYQLPLSLTGEENHLSFAGPLVDGVAEMKNSSGSMTCVLHENMCRVKYEALAIDPAKAEVKLRAMDLSEPQVLGHLQVTARFGGDMEGVIHSSEIR